MEATVEECVVDRLSILQRYHPEDSRPSLAEHENPPPQANPAIRLNLPPDWGGKHIPTPFEPDIWPLTQHLILEIA